MIRNVEKKNKKNECKCQEIRKEQEKQLYSTEEVLCWVGNQTKA